MTDTTYADVNQRTSHHVPKGKLAMPGIDKTMKEYGAGKLHSGSKNGPVVTNRKQAIAIGLSEQRKAGTGVASRKTRGLLNGAAR